MLQIGIVGLPNSGKSTLFNALVKGQAAVAPYPFTTIEPNLGVVAVPDERLTRIAQIAKPTKTTPATVEFVDIAGLVKNASKGEGLGNQFLAKIREVDAVCFVIRAFSDPNVPHVHGGVNPKEDLDILKLELSLADEQMKEKSSTNPDLPRLLLATKPALIVVNVDETALKDFDPTKLGLPSGTIPISAKMEVELNALDTAEQGAYLDSLGISEPGLPRIIREALRALGLIVFYTTISNELRAWPVQLGTKAPQAARIIHTDFEKGFIKAEVIAYEDFVKYAGETAAREAGRMRMEGKEYVVRDGDVIRFRFQT